jgi:hypothetical protein
MSLFHCACGHAADDPESFADHLGWVFDRDDDIGTDGATHAEVTQPGAPAHRCSCGYSTSDAADFNDHLLFMVIPADSIGADGTRHALVDPTTPRHWYAMRPSDD